MPKVCLAIVILLVAPIIPVGVTPVGSPDTAPDPEGWTRWMSLGLVLDHSLRRGPPWFSFLMPPHYFSILGFSDWQVRILVCLPVGVYVVAGVTVESARVVWRARGRIRVALPPPGGRPGGLCSGASSLFHGLCPRNSGVPGREPDTSGNRPAHGVRLGDTGHRDRGAALGPGAAQTRAGAVWCALATGLAQLGACVAVATIMWFRPLAMR